MRFKKMMGLLGSWFHNMSTFRLIIIISIAWLIGISMLHYQLNIEKTDKKTIHMGYMPVITNFSAPILDFASKNHPKIKLNAIKFSSFSDMGEALRNDQIQVAFIIAPLAIVLYQQGVDIKVIYVGNRHESTLVCRKGLKIKTIKDLVGKSIAVPMRYSGHYLGIRREMEKYHLENQIQILEINPPDMPAAISVGSLDAYFVGEPFAAQALKNNNADLINYVEDIWKNFICNVVIVKKTFIEKNTKLVQEFVTGAINSGFWVQQHPDHASDIAASYWNQPADLIKFALTHPKNRVIFDQYLPKMSEFQYMANLMKKYALISSNQIEGLVDDHFAQNATVNKSIQLKNIFKSNF